MHISETADEAIADKQQAPYAYIQGRLLSQHFISVQDVIELVNNNYSVARRAGRGCQILVALLFENYMHVKTCSESSQL
jgi:hypothetical protein